MKISCTLVAIVLMMSAVANAQEKKPTAPEPRTIATPLTEAEQKFAALLTGSVLVGKFSIDSRPDANPTSERYNIEVARKVKDGQWIIQARMKVGQNELPIPVPVEIQWAGDTPMLLLTDLTIPLVGEGFTSRILFYGDRYAGTWQHGVVGGHMWGKIERASEAAPAETSK